MQHVRGHLFLGPKAWSVWSSLLLLVGVGAGSGCSLRPPGSGVTFTIDTEALARSYEQEAAKIGSSESTLKAVGEAPERFFANEEDRANGFRCLAVLVSNPGITERPLPFGKKFRGSHSIPIFSSLVRLIELPTDPSKHPSVVQTDFTLPAAGNYDVQIWGLQGSGSNNCPPLDDRKDESDEEVLEQLFPSPSPSPSSTSTAIPEDSEFEVYALTSKTVSVAGNRSEEFSLATNWQSTLAGSKVFAAVNVSIDATSSSSGVSGTCTEIDKPVYLTAFWKTSTSGETVQSSSWRKTCESGRFSLPSAELTASLPSGTGWALRARHGDLDAKGNYRAEERSLKARPAWWTSQAGSGFTYARQTGGVTDSSNTGLYFQQDVPPTGGPENSMTLVPYTAPADALSFQILSISKKEGLNGTPSLICSNSCTQSHYGQFLEFYSNSGKVIFKVSAGASRPIYAVSIQAKSSTGTSIASTVLSLSAVSSSSAAAACTSGTPFNWTDSSGSPPSIGLVPCEAQVSGVVTSSSPASVKTLRIGPNGSLTILSGQTLKAENIIITNGGELFVRENAVVNVENTVFIDENSTAAIMGNMQMNAPSGTTANLTAGDASKPRSGIVGGGKLSFASGQYQIQGNLPARVEGYGAALTTTGNVRIAHLHPDRFNQTPPIKQLLLAGTSTLTVHHNMYVPGNVELARWPNVFDSGKVIFLGFYFRPGMDVQSGTFVPHQSVSLSMNGGTSVQNYSTIQDITDNQYTTEEGRTTTDQGTSMANHPVTQDHCTWMGGTWIAAGGTCTAPRADESTRCTTAGINWSGDVWEGFCQCPNGKWWNFQTSTCQ